MHKHTNFNYAEREDHKKSYFILIAFYNESFIMGVLIYFITGVDKKNELPAITFTKNEIEEKSKIAKADETKTNTTSLTDISVKGEDSLQKSEQIINNKSGRNKNPTGNCETKQELITSKERREKMDKDGVNCFKESEDDNEDGKIHVLILLFLMSNMIFRK